MMMKQGRIDIHSHLLPGIDDGCRTIEESVRCATAMVEAGYTHSFVTPHIWPSLPGNTVEAIGRLMVMVQRALDEAGVGLKLMPGGENNLGEHTMRTKPEEVVTYGMAGKFVLIDFWCNRLPDFFEPSIRWLQSLGLTVVIAHPERVRAVQESPALLEYFADLGAFLQGNLQCLSDGPEAGTRRVMERALAEDRYTFLGSDLHRWETLELRLNGLKRAIELVGEAKVDELTKVNPRMLIA